RVADRRGDRTALRARAVHSPPRAHEAGATANPQHDEPDSVAGRHSNTTAAPTRSPSASAARPRFTTRATWPCESTIAARTPCGREHISPVERVRNRVEIDLLVHDLGRRHCAPERLPRERE